MYPTLDSVFLRCKLLLLFVRWRRVGERERGRKRWKIDLDVACGDEFIQRFTPAFRLQDEIKLLAVCAAAKGLLFGAI